MPAALHLQAEAEAQYNTDFRKRYSQSWKSEPSLSMSMHRVRAPWVASCVW